MSAPDARSSEVLSGGGELGERMRAIDWAQTPLGPVEAWPQSLRTCVRIILTSQQPMFVWWGEQLINLYNDAYCSILGGKHPWALGRPAAEVWREIWDAVGPRAAHAIQENKGTFDEALLLIMDRNGYREETYYTFSYSPVPGDTGGPGGILCANSSDTQRIFGERQQATLREISARAAEARTIEDACILAAQALATNGRDLPFAMIYLANTDGTASLVTKAGFAHDSDIAPARIDAATQTTWPVLAVLRTGELQTTPISPALGVPQGPWPEAATEAIGVPIFGSDRSVTGVLVVGRNPFRLLDADYRRFLELLAGQIGSSIGNARAYEAERRRAEALAELDRAKTAFFSNISHEFRTPLTLMLGPTEDALRTGERALVGEALEAVHRNELRLLRLVNALLDFSRIEAGRMQAYYEPTDLTELTRELASAFRSAMERAGLRFDVMCEPLPDPVYVDRGMWEKIVLNLLSNALKFTFAGSVRIGLRAVGDAVELTVADSGTGVPQSELPRLFERFHRVEGARSRTHEGSGIGLALTSELVKLHHGTLDVVSHVGHGTQFTVRIPTGKDHLPAEHVREAADATGLTSGVSAFVEEALRWLPTEEPQAPTMAEVAGNAQGARILVADDNADMRAYLRRLLGERWQVQLVGDGADALAAARAARPDLILTDVMMPRLDGFGLLRALRADPTLATVPVVMLSARAGEEARIEGMEAGADDYLIKPFSARELMARVSNMLQLAGLRRDVEIERNRLTAFVQQTPVAVAIWEGPDLRCRLNNEAHSQLLRRPIVVGERLVDLVPEIVGTPTLRNLERVYREGVSLDTRESRVVLRDANGDEFVGYYSTSFRPFIDSAGRVTGVISVTVDVTAEVSARQAIESSRAAAESANRAKDEFLAMLGHELRNPLAPILTALDLMRMRGSTAHERERAVIQRQTQHLATLVEDLLDVSRITRGMVELKRRRTEIADVLAKAIETAAPVLEQQRHELDVVLPPGLLVDVDISRLTQVFSNLLTNAAKYTDRGGQIRVRARSDDAEIAVSITDTGRGIAADMLPRVFDLFTQEKQNIDRSRGGLGLGLAIVRSLVALHGGRVEASSEGIGKGSTFTVTLPRAEATPAEITARQTILGLGGRALSVLVVDDNVDAATMLAEVLATHGYRTRVVHDAPQALALAPEFVPDVALVDIGLPAMDGYELARRLRELPSWRHVRLFAVTGYGQASDRERSKDAGFDRHLVKPIDLATLQHLLPGLGET